MPARNGWNRRACVAQAKLDLDGNAVKPAEEHPPVNQSLTESTASQVGLSSSPRKVRMDVFVLFWPWC